MDVPEGVIRGMNCSIANRFGLVKEQVERTRDDGVSTMEELVEKNREVIEDAYRAVFGMNVEKVVKSLR